MSTLTCEESIVLAACIILCLGGWTVPAPAQGQTIENEFLKVEVKGQVVSLTSKASGRTVVPKAIFPHKIGEAKAGVVKHPVWGNGKTLTLLHANGWKTTLALYPASPFAHVHTEVVNRAEALYEANALDYLKLHVDLGTDLEKVRVLGTGGLTPVEKSRGSYTFSAVADPATRRGVVCGWLTHEQGTGVFFPKAEGGKAAIDARVDFGQYRVKPGGSRPTEILVVGCFDDARLGLEAYADAVAKHYAIRLKPKPGVYCTWYHGGASNEKEIAQNTAFAKKHL